MVNLLQERESLIKEITTFEKAKRGHLKKLITNLANNLSKSIDEKRPDVINLTKIVGDEGSKKAISRIIMRLKEKHEWTFDKSWVSRILPPEYKQDYEGRDEEQQARQVVDLSDRYLKEHGEELIDRIKRMNRGPTQEPKVKETREDMERYTWKCWLANELAKLAIKLESEHEDHHDKSLCQEYAKRAKTARDGRFATPLNNYEGIIVACTATTSLKNAVSGETTKLTRWEVEENEKNCRECLGKEECKRTKCKHVCHQFEKQMTTKGLKYAIKTDPYLKELDEHMKRLMEWDNDICAFGKILLQNKKTDKFLDKKDKKTILARHIAKDECIQCESFLEDHPKFFEK